MMSEDGRIDRALALLARPGASGVLQAMYSRGGAATFAQIAAESRHALNLLRALAAEGFVVSYRCGSLDIEPCDQVSFSLTAKGEAVAGHLLRLRRWMTTRPNRRGIPRPAQ